MVARLKTPISGTASITSERNTPRVAAATRAPT